MAAPFSYFPATYNPAYIPMMQQPQQQVQMQQAQQPQQAQTAILWVRNEQEAAMYPVAPNNAVPLWDSSAPVLYLKQADAAGKPTMKIYDLVERSQEPQNAFSAEGGKVQAYATKDELAALAGVVKDVDDVIAKLRDDVNALKDQKKTVKKKEVDE